MNELHRRLTRPPIPPHISRRLTALADELALPKEWTVAELTSALERILGYRIVWLALPQSAPLGLCGLRIPRPHDALVFHRAAEDPAGLRRALAHTAAHLLITDDRDARESDSTDELLTDVVQTDCAAASPHVGEDRMGDELAERVADQLATLMLTRTAGTGLRMGLGECPRHS